MKRLSVILLSAVFALALHSCGDDDPIYEEYLEYPGDLAALGFSGPVQKIWITSTSVAKGLDGSYLYYISERTQLYFDTDGNLNLKIVSDYEYIKQSNGIVENRLHKIYEYAERDDMGRVTRETIVDEMGAPLADISYAYDDDNRKCRIKYEENGAKEKTGSVRLDEYGFYGSLLTTDSECLTRLKMAKENRNQQPYTYAYDDYAGNLKWLGYDPEDVVSGYIISFSYEYY